MNISVLDAATLGSDLNLDLFHEFGKLKIYRTTSIAERAEHLTGADIAVLNKVCLDADILNLLPDLKLICVAATGFDNIDLEMCRKRGIAVCNVVGYSTQCVAQVTLAIALSLMTHLDEYTASVRDGSYTNGGTPNRLFPVYHEIAGKTWGIIGFGNIGAQVGVVARAMGCRVLVHKRTPIPDWECIDMSRICRESDILSIHTPLNESTRNLLNREYIAMLKTTAIVINVARGAVVDEAALAEAVRQGKIGGIGVDVYSAEPLPAEHPYQSIRHLPNVCLTPHMAWGGYETRARLLSEIAENIRSFRNGERRNRVD